MYQTAYENPIIAAKGDDSVFCRRHIYYKNGKKQAPLLKPITTAQQAIELKRPVKRPVDCFEQGTQYPLSTIGLAYLMLLDFDNVVRDGTLIPEMEEIKERIRSYVAVSWSGNGRHIILPTDLTNIYGKKHLDYQIGDTPGARVQVFVGYQPIVITNRHDVIRPLANCDTAVLQWIDELEQAGKRLPNNNNNINNNNKHDSGLSGGDKGIHLCPSISFTGFLTAHTFSDKPLSPVKWRILEYLWNVDEYAYGGTLKPLYVEAVARKFHISRQLMGKHLRELEAAGWLTCTYGKYTSGKTRVSIRLNMGDDIQIGNRASFTYATSGREAFEDYMNQGEGE